MIAIYFRTGTIEKDLLTTHKTINIFWARVQNMVYTLTDAASKHSDIS